MILPPHIDEFSLQIRLNKKWFVGILFIILISIINGCEKNELDKIDDNFPQKLSEIGVFKGPMSDLIPTSEYTFYELSSVLYSDYASG